MSRICLLGAILSAPLAGTTANFRVLLALKSNKPKKLGVTKSFRLDEDIITKIAEQAGKNNTSLNAEINSLLRKHIEWDVLASKAGMIHIAKPVLSEIFERIMTREEVIKLANRIAKNAIPEMVYFMKGSLTLESFLSWIKTRMEDYSEVNYTIEENSVFAYQIMMIFKHNLGENWSIYHKIILEHILKEILKINTVEIQTSATTLILCFKEFT
jgi:hypothetical protein